MHGVLTEKVKPCNMRMQIFHFTVQYAYLQEGKRVFSFVSKPKIFPNNNIEHKIRKNNTFQTDFSFMKAIRRGRISFPKRKTQSTLYANAFYFFILIEIVLNA